MKISKFLIVFIGIISIFMGGCTKESSNQVKNDDKKIVVQNRIGQDDKYEQFRKITEKASVKKVKDILDHISWKNAKVSMVHPPEYKFFFEGNNTQSNMLIYELYISPNNEKVELVIDSASKYVQLDKKNSAELFELLTGEKLSDLK